MSPELEMIDQLLGGDLSLPVVRGFFPDDDRARRALANYVSKGVVLFITDKEGVLPKWKCEEMFRRLEPLEHHNEVRVSLTHKAAKMFDEGDWSKL
jgi:hypothetical protein